MMKIIKGHARNVTIKNKGRCNTITINGGGLYHKADISIQGNNNRIEICRDCALANMQIVVKGNNCKIVIGEETTSNGTSLYCVGDHQKLTIGRDCMFAADTEVWTSDTHTIINYDDDTPCNTSKSGVTIGNHVWIAEHAKVLKGVHVADNCVLGMCGVLTNDTEPRSLYVGIPARKIKEGISWKR